MLLAKRRSQNRRFRDDCRTQPHLQSLLREECEGQSCHGLPEDTIGYPSRLIHGRRRRCVVQDSRKVRNNGRTGVQSLMSTTDCPDRLLIDDHIVPAELRLRG